MTLRGKLTVNAAVTVAAVLVVGVASLIGFYNVKGRIGYVTDNSTPYQLKTLEFTKVLQEHAAALLAAGNASGQAELAGKERELKATLGRLRVLTTEIGALNRTTGVAEMGRTVADLEGLTGEVVASAGERVRAEDRAADVVKEAKVRLRMLAENRFALQVSLKALQETAVASLMGSSSKTKLMTGAFRSLQRMKDLFEELRIVFTDLERASSDQDLSIARGRITFLLQELKTASADFASLGEPLALTEEQLLGEKGVLSLKAGLIAQRTDAQAGALFAESRKSCGALMDRIARLIVENGEDATFAFYAENSSLEEQLKNSDGVNTVMLLNTQMAAVMDAVEYSVQNLFAEHSERRIEEMQAVMAKLFESAERIKGRISAALGPEGRLGERALIGETAAGLARVEELVMKRGGMVEALKAAAATRARSAELGERLARMVAAQKTMSARSLSAAQGEQQRSVGAVNFFVRAATILLLAAIALVLALSICLVCPIARSIMTLVKDLETAKEGAESASRIKSQFLANMSHEIRTPMNGVIGLLELLKAESLSEKQRNYVSMAFSSGVALLNVINDVLDFSKIEAGGMEINPEPFDLHESVEEAVSFFAEQAQAKRIEMLCHILPGTPRRAKGDVVRIRQILINLIGNAVKFTSSGEIAVECGLEAEDDASLTLRFKVRDTGIGISPAARLKIFDSFSQADASTTRRFGGTGLGLSIARQLVHMMGGEVGVESEVGAGSIFWFTVRMEKASAAPDDADAEAAGVGCDGLAGLKVLIVDDNATNRSILEEMLMAWGLRPCSAASGPEALKSLKEAAFAGVPFRLAVLDMLMPDMDGIELAVAIRSAQEIPPLPLIMLTSVDGKGDSDTCREAGFALRLVKPVRQSQLLNAIESIMGVRDGREAQPAAPESPRLPGGLCVLLVEDYPVNQKVGRAMLEYLGCSVDVAENGRIAVDLYGRKGYDLILMDCQMPEMDGYEATRVIRSIEAGRNGQGGHITIIALTAHAMEGDREKSIEAGMDDHLSKPFTLEQLKAVLAAHLPAGKDAPGPVSAAPADSACASAAPAGDLPAGDRVIDPAALERIREVDPDGRDGLARTVITCYLTDAPRTIESLRSAVGTGDGGAIQKLAHGFKSSSANVGAVSLAARCKEMETAGRNNLLDGSPALLICIENEFARARAALEGQL
jgi:signal transduction histidine kinase/CheY-like chemotaxis protein/HPt (histidine-containing phosphotransfer) domain-containing protein